MSSSSGDKDAWKGFGVRSLKVINSVELKCILSSGDDGTVRVLAIDGSLTANALPVATGFKKQEGSESARAALPASSWSLDMDIPRKELLLNEAANATLTLLDEQQKLVQSIQARIANGERVESFELKDIDRLTRRPSIAAEEEPVLESDEKSLAAQKHHSQQRDRLRRASVGKQEIERANLMGQLMGIETWENSKEVSVVKPVMASSSSGSIAPLTSGTPAKQPAKDSPLMDPSVRTLVELAKSDAEDLLNARLASIGKPRVHRAVKNSSEARRGGKLDDGENEEEGDNPSAQSLVSISDGAAAEALALAKEREAAIKEAEMRIEKVRAAASRAEFEKAPGTVSLPGGFTIFDPAKKAQQERDVAKQRHNYPSLYAEMFKETGNAATAASANKGDSLGLVHDGMSLAGNSTLPMSPFMMANFHKLKSTPTKGSPQKSLSASGGFQPLTSKSASDLPLSPMPTSTTSSGKAALLTFASSPLVSPRKPAVEGSAAVGGAANAVAALQQLSKSSTAPERAKKAESILSLLNTVIHEPEPNHASSSSTTTTTTVAGQITKPRSFELVQRDVADRTSSALKDEVVKTTAQLLSERMKAREMKKKEEEAAVAAAAAAASALSMAKAFAGLVDEEKEAEAKKIAKYGAPPPKKREKKLSLAQQQLADAAARSAAMPKMSPAQYYIVNKRNRIGGQLKRDVLAFADMIRRVDEDQSGEISLDEFRAEVESGGGGLSHLGRHLESMFRAADKDGSGTLSVPELANILFAKALPAQRDEIVAFVTYQGPSPKDMVQNEKREFSNETKQQLADLFSIYDSDGSGSISVNEMEQALLAVQNLMSGGGTGQPTPKQMQQNREAAKKMMKLVDVSGDGEVSLDEFITMMGPSFEPDE